MHNIKDKDLFGEYVPETPTAGKEPASLPDAPPPDEIDTERYGIDKPRRIIVRGNIAADSDNKEY
jgi:hypothetical protein